MTDINQNAKPYSQACENNKHPILMVLKDLWQTPVTVVEIGSGTGQHGVYFSQKLSHLVWQFTDLEANIPGIEAWRLDVEPANEQCLRMKPCMILDVCENPWPLPLKAVDAFYSANTAHIMSIDAVQAMISGVGEYLKPKGLFCLYGPFKYQGEFTSESNAAFDEHLKAWNPRSGIRDIEALMQMAADAGITLLKDYDMPANNRLLVWQKN